MGFEDKERQTLINMINNIRKNGLTFSAYDAVGFVDIIHREKRKGADITLPKLDEATTKEIKRYQEFTL